MSQNQFLENLPGFDSLEGLGWKEVLIERSSGLWPKFFTKAYNKHEATHLGCLMFLRKKTEAPILWP
jgi:hypothetical protein